MADAEQSKVNEETGAASAAGGPAKNYYFVHVEQVGGGQPVATGIIRASAQLTQDGDIEKLKGLMIDCASKVEKSVGEDKYNIKADVENYKNADDFNKCAPASEAAAAAASLGGAKRTRLRKTKSNKNKRNRRKSRRQ